MITRDSFSLRPAPSFPPSHLAAASTLAASLGATPSRAYSGAAGVGKIVRSSNPSMRACVFGACECDARGGTDWAGASRGRVGHQTLPPSLPPSFPPPPSSPRPLPHPSCASPPRSLSGRPIHLPPPPLGPADGQVGRGVVSLLAGSGVQCVIPWRGDDMEWRHLKVMGDVGVVAPMPFSPRDDASIDRALEGCDVVVNLIGKDFETKHYVPNLVNFSFEEVHVALAEKIARKAVQHGASTLVHVSALAADPFALSAWARSKARGEEAVRAVAPGATIVRPADVFGPEDRFLNLFARMYKLMPRIVLVDGGAARVQPLFVHDLAQAIYKVAVAEDPEVMLGQTYDLAGPDEYTYREVVEYVFESIRADKPEVANVSPAVADAIGRAFGLMPQWIRDPLVTRDTFLRMQSDVVLDDLAPTKRLHDLGIEATSMEMPGFSFLHRHRSGSHFVDIARDLQKAALAKKPAASSA